MQTSVMKTIALGAALAAAGAGQAQEAWPTPAIAEIVDLEAPHTIAYAMRGELGRSGEYLGPGVICATRGPYAIEVTAFFGAFPADRRSVQLAVRGADGTVVRFGPVVTAGRSRDSTARASWSR